MPQLDFNVAFSNFIFLIFFFIFFYLLIYFFIFPRLFKMILVRRFFLYRVESIRSELEVSIQTRRGQNSKELKKLFLFIKNII
jgi:hypothetical protein